MLGVKEVLGLVGFACVSIGLWNLNPSYVWIWVGVGILTLVRLLALAELEQRRTGK